MGGGVVLAAGDHVRVDIDQETWKGLERDWEDFMAEV